MRYVTNIARGIQVSEEDKYLLHNHTWRIQPDGYVVANVYGKSTYLHKLILESEGQVDHKDRNKLNCRRDNLRKVTDSQNKMNREIQSNNTSGYIGVSKMKNNWCVQVKVNGKRVYNETFVSKEEAAFKRDIAVKKLHGEFAVLNFDLNLV